MASKVAKSASVNDTIPSEDDVSRQTLGSVNEELIMDEILTRLPVESLIRFKLVSKKWNSTISSLEFAKLHLKLSFQNNRNRHFIIDPGVMRRGEETTADPCCLLRYAPCVNQNEVIPLLQVAELREGDYLVMVDSCNGLVCLYQYYSSFLEADMEKNGRCFFIVWNPATRQHRQIPSPEGLYISKAHGFGYVSSLDDYVIVASFGAGVVGRSTFRGFYVFSFSEGKWERVCEEEYVAERLFGVAVMVGDTMFWYSDDFFGFNVVTKELKVYPCLSWQYRKMVIQMCRVKGCLSFLLGSWENKNNLTDLWMLKSAASDWCSDHSWQKVSSLDFKKLYLLTFSETGKCLVWQEDEFKLLDPCQEALDSAKNNDLPFRPWVIAKDHIESLISPFCP